MTADDDKPRLELVADNDAFPDEAAEDAVSADDGEAVVAATETGDAEETAGDGAPDPQHLRLLEAILFASAEPMSDKKLANRLPEGADVKGLLTALAAEYAERGVNLVHAGASWAFRTAPDLTAQLNREVEVQRRLSRAAVETLAIIAYHQPITRAEIEDIRGVSVSKGTVDVLLEAGWVKPGRRRETPGRPLTWRTTDDFLDHFGLEDTKSLPGIKELRAAGLLESGPALNIYRERHGIDADGDGDGETAAVSDEEDTGLLPINPVNTETEEEAIEPLDPQGG